MKKLPLVLSLLLMLFLTTGSFIKSHAAPIIPDYAGSWDVTFYDANGKVQGTKTISIGEDGSIYGKAILSIDNVIYLTEISGSVNASGKVGDGKLTDTDKLDSEGKLSGSFTETEGSGTWKDYYGKSGTWKAKRSTKEDKRG